MLLTLLISLLTLVSLCFHLMQYRVNERMRLIVKEQDRQLTAQANIISHLYRSKSKFNAQLN